MRKTSHEKPEVGPKPTGLGHQDPSGPHSPVNLQAVRLGKPNGGIWNSNPQQVAAVRLSLVTKDSVSIAGFTR